MTPPHKASKFPVYDLESDTVSVIHEARLAGLMMSRVQNWKQALDETRGDDINIYNLRY
jgi:hypothetical protein